MEPFHEQETQDPAPPGANAIADVENIREAAPKSPAIDLSKMSEMIKTEYGEDSEVYQASKTYCELMPLYTAGVKQTLTDLRSLVLELNSKHGKENEFDTGA